jgi:hypothetical protein
MMACPDGYDALPATASVADTGLDPAFVRDLVVKAKAGMEIARHLTVLELKSCGIKTEAADLGRYLVDGGGVVYVTVRVDWSKSGVPLAENVEEVLYRLGINDRELQPAVLEVSHDAAKVLLPRLYEVDMESYPRELGATDPTGCMM